MSETVLTKRQLLGLDPLPAGCDLVNPAGRLGDAYLLEVTRQFVQGLGTVHLTEDERKAMGQ